MFPDNGLRIILADPSGNPCWKNTINAKLINKFKEAYVDLNKTDDIDPWIIADRLRFGRLPKTMVMQEQYVALQRLTRMRYHLTHNLVREKQYFLQNLFFTELMQLQDKYPSSIVQFPKMLAKNYQ